MLQIILSSSNFAKKQAVVNFFQSQKLNFELLYLDVDSGVTKTPNSDEEGIVGCKNRIKNAQKEFQKLSNPQFEVYLNAEDKQTPKTLFIGMEGIITINKFGTFLGGWICLEIDGSQYLGCSGRCQLPFKIAQNADSFKELSQTVKDLYQKIPNINQLVDQVGTNGLLTSGLYTRTREFEDALRCSWGLFAGENNN